MNQNNMSRLPPPSGGFNNDNNNYSKMHFNGYSNYGPQHPPPPRNAPPLRNVHPRFFGPNNRAYFNNNSRNQPYFPYAPSVRNLRPSQNSRRFLENQQFGNSSNGYGPSSNLNATAFKPPQCPPPRGPRTPPYPPPSDDSGSEIPSPAYEPLSSLSPKKKPCTPENKERRNKQKIKRRRNSCNRSHKSAEEPSPLNTAVQAYLLQVLTSQPPPEVLQEPPPVTNASVPSAYHNDLSPSALVYPPLSLPCKLQTPPPLPPTPIHMELPPPPPSPAEKNDNEQAIGSSNELNNVGSVETTTEQMPSSLTIDIPIENVLVNQENDKATERPMKIMPKRCKSIFSQQFKDYTKNWTMEEAELALKTEQELTKDFNKDTVLYLRFPDPPLNSEIVKGYSEAIESVHFQHYSSARFCFVYLKQDVDANEIIENISKIPFGEGFVKAELRQTPLTKTHETAKVDNIDPFTLYVGNLSNEVPCRTLKQYFPGAARIDIGFAQRIKHTRYAFVRYRTVDEAVAAFRRMWNHEINGRSVIMRFRRTDNPPKNPDFDNSSIPVHHDEEQIDACSVNSTSTVPSDLTEDVEILRKEENNAAAEEELISAAKSDMDLNKSLVSLSSLQELSEVIPQQKEPKLLPERKDHENEQDQTENNKSSTPIESETGNSENNTLNTSTAAESTTEHLTLDIDMNEKITAIECETGISKNNILNTSIASETIDEPPTQDKDTNDDITSDTVTTEMVCNDDLDKSTDQLDLPARDKDADVDNDSVHANANTNSMEDCIAADDAMAPPSITAESIKSEPNDADADDNIAIYDTTHRPICNIEIKEEESRLEADYEFFSVGGGGSSTNEVTSQKHFAGADSASVALNASDSSSSLSDFLKLCESSRDTTDGIGNKATAAQPPAKRSKRTETSERLMALPKIKSSSHTPAAPRAEIKEEYCEEDHLMETTNTTSLSDKENRPEIKQESNDDLLDQDILIIDSEDCLLSPIHDNTEDKELISNLSIGRERVISRNETKEEDDDEDLVPSNAFAVQGSKQALGSLPPLLPKEEDAELEEPSQSNATSKSPSIEPKRSRRTTINNQNSAESRIRTKICSDNKSLSKKCTTPAKTPDSDVEPFNRPMSPQISVYSPKAEDTEDDDLVPANNALCSSQRYLACFDLTLEDEPPKVTVKSELETEDLFLLPKNMQSKKIGAPNKNLSANTRQETPNKNCFQRKDPKSSVSGTKRDTSNTDEHCKDSDTEDDVIIIVDDDTTTPGTHRSNRSKSFPKPIRMPCSTDHIKRKTSSPVPSLRKKSSRHKRPTTAKDIEKSFFGKNKISRHGDNLDRLFELLNSDSEDEL